MNRFASALAASALAVPALASRGAEPTPEPVVVASLFGGLRSGEGVGVHREVDELAVYDSRSGQEVLVAYGDVLTLVSPFGDRRPEPGEPARVEGVRDAAGNLLYTFGLTSRGGRVLVVPPGVVDEDGLHVLTFDGGDFHVSAGDGRFVASRATRPDGSVVERQSAEDGCGCERTVTSDGRITLRPF